MANDPLDYKVLLDDAVDFLEERVMRPLRQSMAENQHAALTRDLEMVTVTQEGYFTIPVMSLERVDGGVYDILASALAGCGDLESSQSLTDQGVAYILRVPVHVQQRVEEAEEAAASARVPEVAASRRGGLHRRRGSVSLPRSPHTLLDGEDRSERVGRKCRGCCGMHLTEVLFAVGLLLGVAVFFMQGLHSFLADNDALRESASDAWLSVAQVAREWLIPSSLAARAEEGVGAVEGWYQQGAAAVEGVWPGEAGAVAH